MAKKLTKREAAIRRHKKRVRFRIFFSICMILSITAGFLLAKAKVTLEAVAGSAKHSSVDLDDVDISGIAVNQDQKIINVLIIGNDYRKDFYGEGGHGLPDSMMIATLDTKHKALKLTSLMRDQVVQIPGHGENKLNSVFGYSDGGVKLLYKTIAQNFNIKLDGYVELGFDAVEEVVNSVGGINVELTESEANYLNTTNYISKKKYRHVKVGMNKLNGNQALGYSRIRKTVFTPNGLTDDYGRTWRQRNVITATFSKIKGIPLSNGLKYQKKYYPIT